MTHVLFAKKIGMETVYSGDTSVAVTALSVLPLKTVRSKSVEKDGYAATVVSYDLGKKAVLREVSEAGDAAALLAPGASVAAQGTSKGKGTAGVVKRYHFAGGPRTHGQSDRLRRPGSIGQGTTPGRIYKGKHMMGRMGTDTVTIKTQVVAFVPEKNLLTVKGPIPGSRGTVIRLELA